MCRCLFFIKYYVKLVFDVEVWDCGRYCVGVYGGVVCDVYFVCIGFGGVVLVFLFCVVGIRCIIVLIMLGLYI